MDTDRPKEWAGGSRPTPQARHATDLAKIESDLAGSCETFVVHYKSRYDDPPLPPIWAIVETMTLGTLSRWFSNTSDTAAKKEIMQTLQNFYVNR